MRNIISHDILKRYIEGKGLIPPLSFAELKRHASEVGKLTKPNIGLNLAAVMLNNALWWDIVASVPFERRILMLPQCLRDPDQCHAEMDGIGLICDNCGACAIGELQKMAGDLGYIVLVAEGTSVVTKLIESGKIDAVVGVSCVNALERAFPHMAAGAVPGIAIPLENDGCNRTTVDVPAVRAAIKLRSLSSPPSSIDIDNLLEKISEWFEYKRLASILTSGEKTADPTKSLALKWLSKTGKRWRPFLTAAVYSALTGISDEFPDSIIKIAIAVECFHKASLIHDDIEDGDDFRYGESTLHMLHGVPVALNVGDYLIGVGYALIADSGTSAKKIASMLGAAAHCHKKLCLGQGAELTAAHGNQAPLSVRATLDVFRGKTSPAFETALTLGAICADADPALLDTLRAYSEALGTAYQIKDDIEDFASTENSDPADGLAVRTSIIIAIAFEQATKTRRKTIIRSLNAKTIDKEIFEGETKEKAFQLLEHYRHEAIRSIDPLRNAALKSLLRRIITKATANTL